MNVEEIEEKLKNINEIMGNTKLSDEEKLIKLRTIYNTDFKKASDKIKDMKFLPFRNPDVGETSSELYRFGQYVALLQDKMEYLLNITGLDSKIAFVSNAVSEISEEGIKVWKP